MQDEAPTIGFIGLGVMGSPMCRNMADKYDGRVIAFDLESAAVATLEDTSAEPGQTIADVAENANVIFLSLPGGTQVEAVCRALLPVARRGSTIVDLSTTSVADARNVGRMLHSAELQFADAPVARTREAAQRGELSIMVGADHVVFSRIRPMLDMIGSDVTHCGDIGAGQVVKLVNNMLVFTHTAVLAEMMVLAERAGVEPAKLLDAVSKGSGDSFVLRNHGMKAMLPRVFPDKAFPPSYVLKDIGYVLELANDQDLEPHIAALVRRYYETAEAEGLSAKYFPSVIEIVEKGGLGALLPPNR